MRDPMRRARPRPSGTQDEHQNQHLDSDGEAIEGCPVPGFTHRVEGREWDFKRCHDEVCCAVRTGGQDHREQDHEDRNSHEREDGGQIRRANGELKDDSRSDLVDGSGLVQVEVVHVDVEEHKAGPGSGELRLDGDLSIFKGCHRFFDCIHRFVLVLNHAETCYAV